ncbi:MAG: DUF4259 domain-containing protein [Phycisphaerales bacterium]
MGAWGVGPFENDAACDWEWQLEKVDDLSVIQQALEAASKGDPEDDFLDADIASEAVAACEVLARLQGNPGKSDSYTEAVDRWVAGHPLTPSASLIKLARAVLDRVVSEQSELRELWDESDSVEWLASIESIRARIGP